MYLPEIVWWGYTAFVAVAALFLLWFAHRIGGIGRWEVLFRQVFQLGESGAEDSLPQPRTYHTRRDR